MPLDKNAVTKKLTDLGALLPCHRCGGRKFTVLADYSAISLQKENKGIHLGGKYVPVALIACTKCGAITPHALGALGMMPKEEKEEEGQHEAE